MRHKRSISFFSLYPCQISPSPFLIDGDNGGWNSILRPQERIMPNMHDHHCRKPPRRARTRCSVAPPSRWYSAAVLSSALYSKGFFLSLAFILNRRDRKDQKQETIGYDVHLLSTEDQSLLNGRNTLLLLDTLFYPRDLWCWFQVPVLAFLWWQRQSYRHG